MTAKYYCPCPPLRQALTRPWFKGTFSRAGSSGQTGDERGNTETRDRPANCAAIRGCPRNCKRRALSPKRPLGNWEGRIKATTREPGDLPARSPNRWTGRPYGAVFRSGDVNAGAKAVKESCLSRHSAREHCASSVRACAHVSFASGLVSPDARAFGARKRRNVVSWEEFDASPAPRWCWRAFAQPASAQKMQTAVQVLPAIVVSATTVPTPSNRSANSVTVITAENQARTDANRTGRAAHRSRPQCGADRRAGRADRGLHARHQFKPRQGVDRRHRHGRSERDEWRLRFCPSADRRHRAHRDSARPAKRALRLGRHRRRDLDHHQNRRGPAQGDARRSKAARSEPSIRRRR